MPGASCTANLQTRRQEERGCSHGSRRCSLLGARAVVFTQQRRAKRQQGPPAQQVRILQARRVARRLYVADGIGQPDIMTIYSNINPCMHTAPHSALAHMLLNANR